MIEPLEVVYQEFSNRLSRLGRVIAAGGAVRDTLMGREPKDFDIFVLQGDAFNFNETKKQIDSALAGLMRNKPQLEWHKSEPYLVADVRFGLCDVQILVNPARDARDLLSTFDWNVCLFAYEGSFVACETIENILPGKSLVLQKITFPLSTLRRGFRFSERFKMKLQKSDVLSLCQKIIENNKIADGIRNEPDMPALSANMLIE